MKKYVFVLQATKAGLETREEGYWSQLTHQGGRLLRCDDIEELQSPHMHPTTGRPHVHPTTSDIAVRLAIASC